MRLTLLIAVAVLLCGCGSKSSTSTSTPTRTTPAVSHAAPDLEALLPAKIDGKALARGSATGAVVLAGGDAFSKSLSAFLSSAGKSPSDLRFANARSDKLGVEAGVFRVRGAQGRSLAQAIVTATRPNAPGLKVDPATLSGKAVTRLVYPGGGTLYLYPHGDLVFYVGTQDEARARKVLSLLP